MYALADMFLILYLLGDCPGPAGDGAGGEADQEPGGGAGQAAGGPEAGGQQGGGGQDCQGGAARPARQPGER